MSEIQTKDKYHGSALTQIVGHNSFKALNATGTGEYGHYVLNNGVRIHVKHSSLEGDWPFTFTRQNLRNLIDDLDSSEYEVFVCLVCGDDGICHLGADDIREIIDLTEVSERKTIYVRRPEGASYDVSGPAGDLDHAVSRSKFPEILFG